MSAADTTVDAGRVPSWVLGVVPLLHVAVAIAAFVGLGSPGAGERRGPPVEELAVGFALHNTTEGLAIVAPIARAKPTLGRLALFGVIAGAPAVLGASIGAAAYNTSVAAFLFGAGAGAIIQVMVQLAPTLRDEGGPALHPRAAGGLLTGLALMFATGLLVSM